MSEMADVITKESVHRLHNAFIEGVLELDRTKAGDLKLNRKSWQAVGEPIARYIHTKLWESSKPNKTGKFIDYPRVSDVSINGMLREEGIEHTGKHSTVTLGTDVGRVLQQAGIALYRRPLWYLKPYNSERVQWYSTHDVYSKTDERQEKRIEEEAKNSEATLTSRIDLRSIQRPKDFTAEEVAAFIERFVPAALKLQEEYETLAAQVAVLAEAAREKDEWKGVVDAIEEAME